MTLVKEPKCDVAAVLHAIGSIAPSAVLESDIGAELAFILPVLVTLVFGIIEFGRYYDEKIVVVHAARESVRALALNSGDPSTAAQRKLV